MRDASHDLMSVPACEQTDISVIVLILSLSAAQQSVKATITMLSKGVMLSDY